MLVQTFLNNTFCAKKFQILVYTGKKVGSFFGKSSRKGGRDLCKQL